MSTKPRSFGIEVHSSRNPMFNDVKVGSLATIQELQNKRACHMCIDLRDVYTIGDRHYSCVRFLIFELQNKFSNQFK